MTQPATLYTTWRQADSRGKLSYFVVWQVKIKEGAATGYTLLRLFEPEFTEVSIQKFRELVEKKAIVEWRMS